MHGRLSRRGLLLSLAPGKLRALIVDGENDHDWPTATQAIREILEATGRFEVRVSSSSPASWRPPRHLQTLAPHRRRRVPWLSQ